MLWHIVKFRYAVQAGPAERAEFERSLRGLAGAIDDIRFLRVAPSIDEPGVVGLVTGFDDEAALVRYRGHPDHLPVIEASRAVCADITRLDLATGDDPGALPRTGTTGAG